MLQAKKKKVSRWDINPVSKAERSKAMSEVAKARWAKTGESERLAFCAMIRKIKATKKGKIEK